VNRPPPKHVPRRSGRPRREPERFQDYVAHGVQLRPSNAKLEAVKALVNSDVLHSMDCDVAKQLLESLFYSLIICVRTPFVWRRGSTLKYIDLLFIMLLCVSMCVCFGKV